MIFPTKNEKYDGIINFVTRKYKNDLSSYIKTSNSSYNYDKYGWGDSNALLDFSSMTKYSDCFCSKDEPLSNVIFYFLKHKVFLKSYTITSRPFGDVDMLKAWEIYGSNDNREWSVIDSKGPTDDLIISLTNKTYDVDYPGKFRFFRITQTDKNSNERDYFLLGKIEFYGELLNEFCFHRSKRIVLRLPFTYITIIMLISY